MLFAYMQKAEPTASLQAAYSHHISLVLELNVDEYEDEDVEMDEGTLKRAY
ncbi:GD25862 [Drosophila simulans]|uniref:GD25862 n=1 Tax=Drosophila simulans TaxID=7240 RepID=B4QC77_DROSI|nr:GD25862 [Drosophila simulans]